MCTQVVGLQSYDVIMSPSRQIYQQQNFDIVKINREIGSLASLENICGKERICGKLYVGNKNNKAMLVKHT